MEKRWYVVQTYAGYENKVMTNLLKRIETMNMQEKIFRVLIRLPIKNLWRNMDLPLRCWLTPSVR